MQLSISPLEKVEDKAMDDLPDNTPKQKKVKLPKPVKKRIKVAR